MSNRDLPTSVDRSQTLSTINELRALVPTQFAIQLGFLDKLAAMDLQTISDHSIELINQLLDAYRLGITALNDNLALLAQVPIDLNNVGSTTIKEFIDCVIAQDPNFPDANTARKSLFDFLSQALNSQPEVNLDEVSRSIITHDVSKHITPQLDYYTKVLYGLSSSDPKRYQMIIDRGIAEEGAKHPAMKNTLLTPIECITNFLNYYGIMISLEAGIPVDNSQFTLSLPSTAEIEFDEVHFPAVSPEAYTAIRTTVLNAIQNFRDVGPEVEHKVDINIYSGQTNQEVLDLLDPSKHPEAAYLKGVTANEMSKEGQFIVFNLANDAEAAAVEKLIASFENYLEHLGSTVEAEQGLRLAINMVKADLATVGNRRKIAALGLKITKDSVTGLSQVNIIFACPDS